MHEWVHAISYIWSIGCRITFSVNTWSSSMRLVRFVRQLFRMHLAFHKYAYHDQVNAFGFIRVIVMTHLNVIWMVYSSLMDGYRLITLIWKCHDTVMLWSTITTHYTHQLRIRTTIGVDNGPIVTLYSTFGRIYRLFVKCHELKPSNSRHDTRYRHEWNHPTPTLLRSVYIQSGPHMWTLLTLFNSIPSITHPYDVHQYDSCT